MQILITGANGTIGSDLVNFFSKKHKIFAIYRNKNFVVRNLQNKNIKWIKHNLKKNFISKIKPDLVIHCAILHKFSKKNDNFNKQNKIILKNIVKFCIKKKIKKFINLSSILVYGQIKNKDLTEKHSYNQQDDYGNSKFFAEKFLNKQTFKVINLRLPGVVSYYNSDFRRPWINKIYNKILKNKKVLTYNFTNGFYNFIDTIEIFKFISAQINKNNFQKGTINFSSTGALKIYFILKKFKKILNSRTKINNKSINNINFVISSNKCIKKYNFKPLRARSLLNRFLKLKKVKNK